ncbi:hypothetical protein OG401_41320 [Kitasatospora purpeofusca]|uniref:hypothetical protein n=1 Tax=Kitasatospora purpeofusca TaxID=67352 RepID=UPI00225AFA16|nr:hypothetical protein [Kitasatospora purpeofusca]MCX4690662.1 hypothetical protein [Kitasatospora purpeofusca]
MPDDTSVPDDLVDLQLAARAAQRAAEEFSAEIAAQAREKFPAPEQWLERLCWPAEPPAQGLQDGPATSFWPEELVGRLTRLREEADTARKKAAAHPAVDDARRAGVYPKFLSALSKRITTAEAEAA